MTTYLFSINDGQQLVRGPHAQDLPSVNSAKGIAEVIAMQLRHDKITPPSWFVRVEDEAGQEIAMIPASPAPLH